MNFPALPKPVHIFFSYAATTTRDHNLVKRLFGHINVLRQSRGIEYIYNKRSAMEELPGTPDEISIDQADIIVLLISPEYFDSDYRVEKEMKRALARSEAGEARLIPVLLSPILLDSTPLGQHTFLPTDGKAVGGRGTQTDRVLSEVSKAIRQAAEAHVGLANAASVTGSFHRVDNIPEWHSRFFTDRKDILSALHTYFASSRSSQQTCIQALSGPMGCGKTQIAIEYVHMYRYEYQATLWLDVTSHKTLKEALVPLAELLSIPIEDRENEPRLLGAIKHWLFQHEHWLFILDNLKDFKLIDLFIPSCSSGHVLLTTHTPATGEYARPIFVKNMSTEDSVVFLLRRAGLIEEQAFQHDLHLSICTEAASIVQEVDGLPLALDQAGAYIEERSGSLTSYLQLYRKQGAMLLDRRGQSARAHPASVKVTLSLLIEEATQEDVNAQELLRLLAFLYPDAIPYEMIAQGVTLSGGSTPSAIALDDAIGTLRKFSLIQRDTHKELLSIHRVVQTILVEGIVRRHRKQRAVKAVCLVNRFFPDAEFGNWATCERYYSQARRCAELIDEYLLVQREAAQLLHRLGCYCYQRAYYGDAEGYLTTALQIYRQGSTSEQTDIAQTLHSLACLYHRQRKYQTAEDYYQQAREIRQQAEEPDEPAIAPILNNLALLYKDWGKYQQAEELYQCVLLIDERTHGLDHPDTAVSLFNLATLYDEQGKHALAESFYQRAFAIEERTLAPDHPDLALSLNTQATLHAEQGNYREAEDLYQRALAIQERIGPEHPDIAQTLNNLASLYEVLKRYQEAEVLYRRALKISKKVLGPEHPATANVLNNLGFLARKQKQYREAELLYLDALKILEMVAGSEHPDTATAQGNLGWLYRLMDRHELAEPLLRRSLAIRERVLGPEHPDTCQSLSALITLFIDQRQYVQAQPLYQRLLDAMSQTYGPEHPRVISQREEYALLLERINEQRP